MSGVSGTEVTFLEYGQELRDVEISFGSLCGWLPFGFGIVRSLLAPPSHSLDWQDDRRF